MCICYCLRPKVTSLCVRASGNVCACVRVTLVKRHSHLVCECLWECVMTFVFEAGSDRDSPEWYDRLQVHAGSGVDWQARCSGYRRVDPWINKAFLWFFSCLNVYQSILNIQYTPPGSEATPLLQKDYVHTHHRHTQTHTPHTHTPHTHTCLAPAGLLCTLMFVTGGDEPGAGYVVYCRYVCLVCVPNKVCVRR